MSSVREQGELVRERDERAQREREEYRSREARALVESWFYREFYEHHLVANPDYRPGLYAPASNPRRIVDPARPLPPLEGFWLASPDFHAEARFECEGIRYVCRWEYRSGGDRADWDDGWWPEWWVVVVGPRWFGRFGYRLRELPVASPAGVVEALAS